MVPYNHKLILAGFLNPNTFRLLSNHRIISCVVIIKLKCPISSHYIQVAFLWARSLGGDSAVKLLTKFNLLETAIDYAADNWLVVLSFSVSSTYNFYHYFSHYLLRTLIFES